MRRALSLCAPNGIHCPGPFTWTREYIAKAIHLDTQINCQGPFTWTREYIAQDPSPGHVNTKMCDKDAENVYAPLVMVSIGAGKRTLAGKTVYKNGSIDTSLDPLLFSLDSTFKFTLRCQQYDIVPIICHGCHWQRRQICHWYQQHQRYRWQNLSLVSLIPEANLPLVLLIRLVHLHLGTFPLIFEQIWNDPNFISRAWGKMIHEKNLKQKISWQCPFKGPCHLEAILTRSFSCLFSLI